MDNKKYIFTPTNNTPPTPTSRPVAISVRDLVKEYKVSKQRVHAVNGISLDIYDGEFVAIIGASGSGKSTLLQLIGGLDKPTSGMVTVNGARLDKMSDGELSTFRNQTIGFVFQFFYLQPFLNLERNIEVASMPNRMKRTERKARIASLAKRVGLADRLRHLPRELSGGQIQRAAIARALLNRPKIILADEPTGNLDSESSAAVLALFKQVRDETNATIVIVTHNPEIAEQADRVITIEDGVIV